MDAFLAASNVIDWPNPEIVRLAESLANRAVDRTEFVCRAFEWVRDQIRHSGDFELDTVTCLASETLAQRAGFCYAKSHLLVALCRAQGIPAGFGYQRLSIDRTGAPYCLHGFAVIDLGVHGWRKLDPRGNKPGVSTEFSTSSDSLAFAPTIAGESTSPQIFAQPLPVVVDALSRFRTRVEFEQNLPDQPDLAAIGF